MSRRDSDYCFLCNVRIAPASPDRCCRTVDGHTVVAHRACLHAHLLPEASRLISRCAEEFGGDIAAECRLTMARASGYRAAIQAMRMILKLVYWKGRPPVAARKRHVRQKARSLENILLDDFTTCLDTPPVGR